MQKTKMILLGATAVILAQWAIWMLFNFDALYKTVKYPEAVRQLKIEVRVRQ